MKEILQKDMLLFGNAFMARIDPTEIEIKADKDGNITEYIQIRDKVVLNRWETDEVIFFKGD